MAKSKGHFITLRIVFDKPVTRLQAVKEARDMLTGTKQYPAIHYCGAFSEAETFRVSAVMKTTPAKG